MENEINLLKTLLLLLSYVAATESHYDANNKSGGAPALKCLIERLLVGKSKLNKQKSWKLDAAH